MEKDGKELTAFVAKAYPNEILEKMLGLPCLGSDLHGDIKRLLECRGRPGDTCDAESLSFFNRAVEVVQASKCLKDAS